MVALWLHFYADLAVGSDGSWGLSGSGLYNRVQKERLTVTISLRITQRY